MCLKTRKKRGLIPGSCANCGPWSFLGSRLWLIGGAEFIRWRSPSIRRTILAMRVRVIRFLYFFHGWVSFIERLLAVHFTSFAGELRPEQLKAFNHC